MYQILTTCFLSYHPMNSVPNLPKPSDDQLCDLGASSIREEEATAEGIALRHHGNEKLGGRGADKRWV